MNKQIEKFALEAREYADKLLGSGLPDTVWQDRYHEKFAELIVRECMSLCDDYNSQKYIANRFGLTPHKLSEMENKNV